MIALRGHLKQQEDKRWKWQGIWAFGALPSASPKGAKNPASRPFNYTWIESESASNVLVPSLVAFGQEEDEEEDEEADAKLYNDGSKGGENEVSVAKEVPDDTVEKSQALIGKENPTTLGPEPMQLNISEKDCSLSTPSVRQEETPLAVDMDAAVASKPPEVVCPPKQTNPGTTPSHPRLMPSPRSKDISFATTFDHEPAYTEGHTVHPEKIPPDGNWTGYFENASNRKDRHSSKVSEHFALFFNVSPAKDARMTFMDDDEDAEEEEGTGAEERPPFEKTDVIMAEDSDAKPTLATIPKKVSNVGLLPPGFVQVRGMGTNQFGTFELLGALDLATGMLECQRMYVVTPDNTKATLTRKKPVARLRTPDGTSRPYSTRKLQLSWQRRSSMSDDEEEMIGMKRFRTTKKRPRSASNSATKPPMTIATPRPPGLLIPVYSASIKRPSPTSSSTLSAGPKKRTPATILKASTPTGEIKLPLVGDPNQARWRAAHFLYYQRHDPSSGENTAANGATFSFVVYEGEMLNGGCQRDGRGVCLFNNGTLYEGEWKRNREHGKGTVMTADRRRIMYEGEWERGRMHGQGTYYYSDEASLHARKTSNVDSRYIGEFKENARHGVGKYYLPDGSTYEGEWRDNSMSGQGTFRWPDGSVYIGQWKDGKRHGIGALTSSDGFTYDGMWVYNAMEGRGIASYPSGQRYEGLWANGRREGRGTIVFTNGAVYEGRFRDDCMEGQGTMKMSHNVTVPTRATSDDDDDTTKDDWMIPISFQSDIGHIHQKAGFTVGGE